MTTTTALDTLVATLGDAIRTDPACLASYATEPAAVPLAVVRPADTAQVQETLRWAHEHRVPVVIRGGGTRLPAGVTTAAALVLSTEALTGVHVDPATGYVTVGAGTASRLVHEAIGTYGRRFPIAPYAQDSTIGGDVATDARGLFAVRDGSAGEYVVAMQVVLADGSAMPVGAVQPFDPEDCTVGRLFAGSDGLLGVITELTLRTVPTVPAAHAVIAGFPATELAAAASFDLAATAQVTALDIVDAIAAEPLADAAGIDADSASTLLVIHLDATDCDVEAVREICLTYGAETVRTLRAGSILDAVVAAHERVLPALREAGTTLATPVTLPHTRLEEFLARIDGVGLRRGAVTAAVTHAVEGITHVFVLSGSESTHPHADAVLAEVLDIAVELLQDCLGDVGDPLRRPWMSRALGAAGAVTDRRMKVALDPRGILNPGVLY